MNNNKFRAWYENSQTWVYFEFDKPMSLDAIKVHTQLCIEGKEFYQFTGLKDKNGKEIYEGDVLKWIGVNENVLDEVFHNQVYWLEYRWRIKGTKDGKSWHSDFTFNQCFNHKVEVIGNIFQDSNLINN